MESRNHGKPLQNEECASIIGIYAFSVQRVRPTSGVIASSSAKEALLVSRKDPLTTSLFVRLSFLSFPNIDTTNCKMKFSPGIFVALVLTEWSSTASAFVPVSQSRTSTLRLRATVPEQDVEVAAGQLSGPDMKAFASGYQTVFEEVPCRLCTPSVGQIPADLKGSYFRAGPAMFCAGAIPPPKTSMVQPDNPPVPDGEDMDRMVRHPFEGDGAILGITFGRPSEDENGQVIGDDDGQTATMRFRYVRTTALTRERKRGGKRYSGMESTRDLGTDCASGLGNDLHLPLFRHHLQPGLNKLRKNTSNSRAIYWGKRLLSMWEGGQPYKMDALALSTEGRSQLGGAIRRDDDPFGSKMVVDSINNRALFYGLEQDASKSEVALYEFGSDFRLIEDGRTYHNLPGLAVLNDFAATQNYAIFVQPPIKTSGMKFMLSKRDPGLVTSFEAEESSLLHLIPRSSSSKPEKSVEIPLTPGVVDANLQFINAYEEGDSIVFDAIASRDTLEPGLDLPKWPWADTMEKYQSITTPKTLFRYQVDTKSGQITKQCLFEGNCAFASINENAVGTQKHRFIHMNVGAENGGVAMPPQGIAVLDCETGTMDSWFPESWSNFCGAPVFAPRENSNGENDGYLLSVMLNGEKQESELLVLDANQVSSGPIARVPLGSLIPHGLFGCFAPEADWASDVIERRAKLADKMESRGSMWNEVKSDFSGLGLRLDDLEEYFPKWEL